SIKNCKSGAAFFLQAEDGIRDRNVTGVQTCALPIYGNSSTEENPTHTYQHEGTYVVTLTVIYPFGCVYTYTRTLVIKKGYRLIRSEERRVGKGSWSRWCSSWS